MLKRNLILFRFIIECDRSEKHRKCLKMEIFIQYDRETKIFFIFFISSATLI